MKGKENLKSTKSRQSDKELLGVTVKNNLNMEWNVQLAEYAL